jgi:predicted transcriptional regulator
MTISLTPEFERLVQVRLAQGSYRTEEEVLQAAFEALDMQEQTLAAIAEGYADFQAGRYRPLDESDAEFRRRHNIPQDQ